MENIYQSLYDFVNVAERNRKIAPDTATGYRVALKLFETVLNEDEKNALSTFKERFEAIYANVINRNKSTLSIATLLRYKSRVKKILQDYEKYGIDPSRMASWNRVAYSKSKKLNEKDDLNIVPLPERGQSSMENEDAGLSSRGIPITRFEIVLRPNVKAIVLTPGDLTITEAKKLKAYIEYLETTAVPDKGEVA